MAKFWREGHVKTRLARGIGAKAASLIHREFTLYLCETFSHSNLDRYLCLEPIRHQLEVEQDLNSRQLMGKWTIEEQAGGDLGNRMTNWFDNRHERTTYKNGVSLLIGCDTPLIDATHVESAAEGLRCADVVLGPAGDGGYYLIGMRNTINPTTRDAIFSEIPWSTHTVFSDTQKRLQELGLRSHELEIEDDIDTVFDLRRFLQQLATDSLCNYQDSAAARKTLLAKRVQSIIEQHSSNDKAFLHDLH